MLIKNFQMQKETGVLTHMPSCSFCIIIRMKNGLYSM